MPDLTTLFLFAAAALSLNLTPGPDMLYVMARSLGQGPRAGIVSALGLSVGYGVHTLLAASGLAALLISAPAAFNAVKVAGALYLAFLGIQALRRSFQPEPTALETLPTSGEADAPPPTVRKGWRELFRQGALTSTLNPSIAIFFLAFLPQFVEPARGTVALQIVALGLVFVTTATTTHTTIALLTGTAGNWLRRRPGTGRWQARLSGAVLLLLGLRVLLSG
jgi:threonine/homoserine/homoserine lactone efflux protein